jgi:Rrf2 family protein
MLNITKKADYGLLFLHALAKAPENQFMSLRTLASTQSLPYKFLSQIASELTAHGLVESREGLGGGYRLKLTPSQISLKQVLDILDGPAAPVGCLRGDACHHAGHCPHQAIMSKLTQVVNSTLSASTLADLIFG